MSTQVLTLPGLASLSRCPAAAQAMAAPGACSCSCPVFPQCPQLRSEVPPHCLLWLSWYLQGPRHIFLTCTANFGNCDFTEVLGVWMSYPLGGIGTVSGKTSFSLWLSRALLQMMIRPAAEGACGRDHRDRQVWNTPPPPPLAHVNS